MKRWKRKELSECSEWTRLTRRSSSCGLFRVHEAEVLEVLALPGLKVSGAGNDTEHLEKRQAGQVGISRDIPVQVF